MRLNFFESQNSHFMIALEGRYMSLLRDTKEVWKKRIEYSNFEILGVTNDGRTMIKAREGIIIYPQEKEKDEIFLQGYDQKALNAQNARVAKVKMEQFGTKLCIEKISVKSKLTEKLFKMISSPSGQEKGEVLHEMVIHDVNTGKEKIFYRFTIDRKMSHGFVWDISPNFSYFFWGEAQKVFKGTETRFAIANLNIDKVVDHFTLDGIMEWDIKINNYGCAVIDSPQKNRGQGASCK